MDDTRPSLDVCLYDFNHLLGEEDAAIGEGGNTDVLQEQSLQPLLSNDGAVVVYPI